MRSLHSGEIWVIVVSWPNHDSEHVMVSAAQMASLENETLSNGLPVAALMEKVGQAMTTWFSDHSDLINDGVVVLVGPGHNGGDGLVVARELHLKGVKVEIWCPIPIKKGLTGSHLAYANWLGIHQLETQPDISQKALWIDALFGLGQTRPLPQLIGDLFKERHFKVPGRLVSLDVPSGICSDTGKTFSSGAAFASFTLSVGLIKKGLVQDVATPYVGRLVRLDIGLQEKVLNGFSQAFPLRILSHDLETAKWPSPDLVASKYQRGRVFVIAGSDKYLGAAWLALQGAIASGAGSIKAFLPKQMAKSLWGFAPEVVLSGTFDGSFKEFAAQNLLEEQDLGRVDSLLIGPGLGTHNDNCFFCKDFLQDFEGLLVLDADAINQLAFSDEGWRWIKARKGPTWITPHISEFRRLFPTINQSSFLNAAIDASDLCGAAVLLKGSHSVIADPNGMAWQLVETAPMAARAGFGDLLAGFVAGAGALAMGSAKGLTSEVLATAAFVHSQAGLRCREGSSPSCIAQSLALVTRTLQSRSTR